MLEFGCQKLFELSTMCLIIADATMYPNSQGSAGGSSTSGSVHGANSNPHPKRRKKRPIHGVKTVAVTRGKSGIWIYS